MAVVSEQLGCSARDRKSSALWAYLERSRGFPEVSFLGVMSVLTKGTHGLTPVSSLFEVDDGPARMVELDDVVYHISICLGASLLIYIPRL